MKFIRSFLWLAANSINNIIINIINSIALCFLVLCTVILISMTIVQAPFLATTQTVPKIISDLTLSTLSIPVSSLTDIEYKSLLASLTGSIAVLVTLWFSFFETIRHFYNKQALKKAALIERVPVFKDGEDDLNIMHKFYNKASRVTVFSGDFSWICLHNDLKNQILRLCDEEKMTLISNKTESVVKKAINDEFVFTKIKKNFQFESDVDLKCSLVQENSSSAFLYKVNKSFEGGEKHICIINSKNDADYLLTTLAKLCSPYKPNIESL